MMVKMYPRQEPHIYSLVDNFIVYLIGEEKEIPGQTNVAVKDQEEEG